MDPQTTPDALQTLAELVMPPWMRNHPELIPSARAMQRNNLPELCGSSLEIALETQPKFFESILPPTET